MSLIDDVGFRHTLLLPLRDILNSISMSSIKIEEFSNLIGTYFPEPFSTISKRKKRKRKSEDLTN
jgi:hypothetical protein